MSTSTLSLKGTQNHSQIHSRIYLLFPQGKSINTLETYWIRMSDIYKYIHLFTCACTYNQYNIQ